MDNDYKNELLTTALDGRIKEVTEYQVNIDNYRFAIERIGDDQDLQPFKTQIAGMMQSSIIEQKKAKIMLDVIKSQLGLT